MHIEILAEDKSGSLVLNHLFKRILADRPKRHTCNVRPHRGKGYFPDNAYATPKKMAGGLLDLLPAKLRAYADAVKEDNWLIVVVMDADDEEPDKLFSRIRQLTLRFSGRLPVVIGLSVEEMEAWILGDLLAVKKAYPEADLNRARHYKQDSICGTWEILAAVLLGDQAEKLIKIGYPAVGQHKSEWASRIAAHMVPARNQSPSFQKFYRKVIQALEIGEHGPVK